MKKGGCGNINVRSYIDPVSSNMVIEVKKTKPQETRLSIVYQGSKNGISSNTDWEDGSAVYRLYERVANSWVKSFKLMVDCPKIEDVCYFKIPTTTKLEEIIFDEF